MKTLINNGCIIKIVYTLFIFEKHSCCIKISSYTLTTSSSNSEDPHRNASPGLCMVSLYSNFLKQIYFPVSESTVRFYNCSIYYIYHIYLIILRIKAWILESETPLFMPQTHHNYPCSLRKYN